jgi:hypothetical protein
MAEKMNKLCDSLGATSVRTNNIRQLIRECPTFTLTVQTSPTAHLHLHHHGGALHREVLKMTEVSAVPTRRRLLASGTEAYFRSRGRDHPAIAIPRDPNNPHARPRSPIHVLSHARAYPRGARSNQTARKVRQTLITGDSKTVADSVARRIGIDEVAAEVLPADKASAVRRFQVGGRKVAMVGDGVNDAPALATASVGIAIGAGTDVAIESAGIILVRSDPRDVVAAIELSRAAYRKMIQNLVWATAYNLVAIPIAGGLLVRWGIDLPMSVGAIAMSASTIIVAANAQLLRGLNLQREFR